MLPPSEGRSPQVWLELLYLYGKIVKYTFEERGELFLSLYHITKWKDGMISLVSFQMKTQLTTFSSWFRRSVKNGTSIRSRVIIERFEIHYWANTTENIRSKLSTATSTMISWRDKKKQQNNKDDQRSMTVWSYEEVTQSFSSLSVIVVPKIFVWLYGLFIMISKVWNSVVFINVCRRDNKD